jgi:hypothetical protein
LTTQDFVDTKRIYRFDPSSEHMGGAGKAGKYLGTTEYHPPLPAAARGGDQGLKQGGYGKVQIHKHSKLDQIARVDEVFAALWFKFGATMPNKVPTHLPVRPSRPSFHARH